MNLKEPLDQLAVPPTQFTRHLKFPDPASVRVYDDTLRDGEQMPGVAFSPEQKLELAQLLSNMGVHVIDPAFPAVSESDRKALQLIVQAQRRGTIRKDIEILAMCRSLKEDIDAVAKQTADDYTFININGQMSGKAQTLGAIKSGQIKLTQDDLSDMKVHVYGNTAVVQGKADVKGVVAGQPMTGPIAFTRVWVKKGGKWQSVAFQQTKVE